ncbi:urea carboxylase [Pseudoduganella umbonata]|uniref:Urea carboxylase n=1 Tax=Pseudoduganella umbonata TaxID=864828 RepID=A0A4P8HPQ8_9BURK|nr:urea carboxylase [Pseudoduganella umbonata]MBB3221268.1 urea carboxylase [Pseudoduganella umbonata]QCP10444.1 urea carboxylase [Pseudoduganella umbonata]
MFNTILIANRGEIACRVIRTARRMGIRSVAIYSEADVESLHVRLADEAICIGPAPAAESYLSADKVLAAARQAGADAIHPGYGFMSENAAFAEACAAAGIVFIGPTPAQMRDFGLKHTARELAQAAQVPLLPGTGLLADAAGALAAAERIGYPVMLKSTAGGGGIGMRLCRDAAELDNAYASVKHLSENNFKNSGIYLEKFVERARHVEVQIFGDGRGNVVSLGERDCSVQRRNQKVIEETPAPGIPEATRDALAETAVRLGRSIAYLSAGTVEYVLDADTGAFYFLEVNTRLQVEHGVTEEVFGVDLVEWMIRAATGDFQLPAQERLVPRGHAMQLRVYAEDPAKNFQPSSGVLSEVGFAAGLRVDTWIERGVTVSPYYDPLVAKLIVTSGDRATSIERLCDALAATRIDGIETNLAYLATILRYPAFAAGTQITQMLAAMPYSPRTVDVLEGGIQTTVQDHPGRRGLWAVGIPPSGPMDAYAHRIANHLAGNGGDAAVLEMTLQGAALAFNCDCTIALAGADLGAVVHGPEGRRALANWRVHTLRRGETLRCGAVQGAGVRAYIAFAGGIDVPAYLGSRATFTLGQFGGHGGRALRSGDVLKLNASATTPRELPATVIPAYGHHWNIAVHYGPHGAPDFFTEDDIAMFFGTDWAVHFNSSRTGVRLVGPKPRWAREDGGEAGLHPSNIHDNAYAIGSVDFTGDMPVILGPDGPSLGGFVCPAVIVSADLWKMGQLKPGDTVRFVRVTAQDAAAMAAAQEAVFAPAPAGVAARSLPCMPVFEPVASAAGDTQPAIMRTAHLPDGTELVFRRAGDDYLLVEFGAPVLDIGLRFRAHALMQAIAEAGLAGIVDLTPGIRSLQVHFEHRKLGVDRLGGLIAELAARLPAVDDIVVPSRIVHLPLAWNDSQTRLAIEKYQTTVRPDAPWCPSNIEFIQRINGLDAVQDVYDIVFNARYMVLGLGDVYLGAPVATPVDPRHRLVTTKYNPARTWTPENAVGIGGAYLCVYGMEGPGGYQFVGRTVQMWNRYRQTASFRDGKPWLLRFFDQIRFYEVSEDELLAHRRDFPLGRFDVRIEETTFSLADYNAFLQEQGESIARFKATQQAAFEAERDRWRSSGQAEWAGEEADPGAGQGDALPDGCQYLAAVVPGSVWKILAAPGSTVAAGDTLAIFESMKMEIPLKATAPGVLREWLVSEGKPVAAGQNIAIFNGEN